jgi:hypothetical protein
MSVELPTVFLTVEIQVGFSSVPMGLPEKNVLSPDESGAFNRSMQHHLI